MNADADPGADVDFDVDDEDDDDDDVDVSRSAGIVSVVMVVIVRCCYRLLARLNTANGKVSALFSPVVSLSIVCTGPTFLSGREPSLQIHPTCFSSHAVNPKN